MLEIIGLSIVFKNSPSPFTINPLSIKLDNNEHLLIIGKNGTGKSSFLKAVANVLNPIYCIVSGSIKFNNQELSPSKIAYIPPNAACVNELTIYEHLSLGLKYNDICKRFDYVRSNHIKNIIESFFSSNLAQLLPPSIDLKTPCSNLSAGQERLLILGTILICPLQIILLDEPTSHLDDMNTNAVISLLKRVSENNNSHLIIATHDTNLISAFSNWVTMKFDRNNSNCSNYKLTGNSVKQAKCLYDSFVAFASKNWKFGFELLDIEKNTIGIDIIDKQILIAGCGIGREISHLLNFTNNITAIDTSIEMLYQCKKRLGIEDRLLLIDMCKANQYFLKESFNLIVCLGNSFGALLDQESRLNFIKSMHTLLKDDGCFIIDFAEASDQNLNYYNGQIDKYNIDEFGSYGMFMKINFEVLGIQNCYQFFITPIAFEEMVTSNGFKIRSKEKYSNGYSRYLYSLIKRT